MNSFMSTSWRGLPGTRGRSRRVEGLMKAVPGPREALGAGELQDSAQGSPGPAQTSLGLGDWRGLPGP